MEHRPATRRLAELQVFPRTEIHRLIRSEVKDAARGTNHGSQRLAERLPVLRVKELNYILYGSEKKIRGQGHGGKPGIRYTGGHMSGYGWIADRSEFPVVWDKNDIIAAAKHVLETVKPTKNGTYFGEYNGFHLYVSTGMRKGKIRITTITPNVRRRME